MKLSYNKRIALTYLVVMIGNLIGCLIGYVLLDKTIEQVIDVGISYFTQATVLAVAFYCVLGEE